MPKLKNNKMDADSDVISDEESRSSNEQMETNENSETFFNDELSNVTFKDMLALQANLGTKVFNATAFKSTKEKSESLHTSASKSKNRPQEISSKVRPKPSFKAPKETQKSRDPRFEEAAGEFSRSHFDRSYSFLDDVRKHEMQKIKTLLKKEKNPVEKKKMQKLLKSMNDREKSKQQKLMELEREKERRKMEKEKILKGKAPFYLKSSTKKKMEREEKMKSLEESGRLKKYLLTKEKKRLAKEGRHVVNL